MAASDTVDRVLREFKRYTGDGLPDEPAGAPLPIGDPGSGPHSPKKSELRAALLAPIEEGEVRVSWAEEWAQSLTPISTAAGGDGVADRSSRHWATRSSLSADDAEASSVAAADLVADATSGFSGFIDGLGYDFGSITSAVTYFDQDWGSIV